MDQPLDWRSFWDGKAGEATDLAATGRSRMNIIGMLHVIRETVLHLEPKPDSAVLDVGCGTGMIVLALSPWVARVHGVDISPKMVERAKQNCALCPNVTFGLGGITDLKAQSGEYDRVLAYSVLQYLKDEEEVLRAFHSLKKALAPNGRAVYSANPDPARKEVYLDRILDKDMTADARAQAIRIVGETLWVAPERMVEIACEAGLTAEIRTIGPGIWQHFYMFDVVLWHG